MYSSGGSGCTAVVGPGVQQWWVRVYSSGGCLGTGVLGAWVLGAWVPGTGCLVLGLRLRALEPHSLRA